MKKAIITSLLFFISLISFGQNYEITAQIKDGISKTPIEFCNIFVFNAKDSIVTKAFTNEKGYFNIPLKRGKYKFIFKMFGYIPDTLSNIYVSADKFLDVYKLTPEENMLNEVTIKANSRQMDLDKDVQIVTSTLKKGAANSYDVLDKVNGLHYDRYNQKITVDNDDNIIILVNGIEKNADYIKNLNPNRLQKIEVIRDPSGRYGLKGYSAVINIILKSDYRGTDINLSNFMIMNFVHKELPFNTFDFGNVSLNFTRKKINFYAGYSPFRSNFLVKRNRIQTYSDSTIIDYSAPLNTPFNTTYKMLTNKFDLGIDYYLSPKQTFSYEANYNYSPIDQSEQSSDQLVSTIVDNKTINSFPMRTSTQNGSTTFNNSIFYVGKYNNKNELNISYTYSLFKSDNIIQLIENNITTNQIGHNTKKYSDFNAEYNYTFNDKIGLDAGYSNIYSQLNNIFYPNESDLNTKNVFSYQDLRNELYSYISYQPIKKIGFKFGIGAENSILSHDSLKNIYTIYEPYLDIKYSPIKMLDIKFKYRSDGKYPSINQLNPFTSVVDWQTVSKGNPNLKPEKTNKISLKFNVMKGLLSVEPYYNFSKNTIINILNQQQDGTWLSTYKNAAKRTEKGVKINFVAPFGKSIFMQNGLKFFKQEISYNGESHFTKNWTMNAQLIYRNKKYNTLVGPFYQRQLFKNLNWQGYNKVGNDLWGFFVQQPFFKQKLNIMLIYVIPINWGIDYSQGSYAKTNSYEEFNNIDLTIMKNMIMFRISYRFSRGKEIKRLNKKINIDNEVQPKRLF